MNDKNDTMGASAESRFTVAPATLFMDVWMGRLIRIGGVSVIAAVVGMLLFLLLQILPLFSGATVSRLESFKVPAGTVAFGEEDSGAIFFFVTGQGEVVFMGKADKAASTWSEIARWTAPAGRPAVTAVRVLSRERIVLLGHADGTVRTLVMQFRTTFAADGTRKVEPSVSEEPALSPGRPGKPVNDLWFAQNSSSKLVVTSQTDQGSTVLAGVRIVQRKGLGGRASLTQGAPFEIASGAGEFLQVMVPSTGDSVLAITKDGEVRVFGGEGDKMSQTGSFRPFDAAGKSGGVSSAGLVFGDVSAVFVSKTGEMRVWAIHPVVQADGTSRRQWGQVRPPVSLPGEGLGVWSAAGNKCFLVAAGGTIQIRNLTTDSVRWSGELDGETLRQAVFSRNYDRLTAITSGGNAVRWRVEDHHPDSSWRAFFGKIWYEGASGPDFVWQSSSGSDEFEAKYSLVPLIYGTIKGTFYALLFALPISLLAAVYVSQFLRPDLRLIVKPVMEVMASLPSVVLGFFAGLWLAPIVDANLVQLLCLLASLAPAGLLAGFLWSSLPQPVRRKVRPGLEFVWLVPFIVAFGALAWSAAPWIESAFFTVTDPSGAVVSDFREWWRSSTGLAYDARNSVVVGFVMGFAVIPIVFTIAEDALSNVPVALTSGSLALGASRWQTVWRVVVPTAISGIVSAVMIGFGRAVGETMIVVMATGNTAVMEANPFNGMRTLSANIAVELPEAPVGHTHFRALFLGAFCLFLLTFVVNTLAEILRQRLRDRYKTV
ncbi:MAG: hypothetical protein RJA37_1563 [Verrucomicrobiota bacterium]|jgi:phosphate transport system permease protein